MSMVVALYCFSTLAPIPRPYPQLSIHVMQTGQDANFDKSMAGWQELSGRD